MDHSGIVFLVIPYWLYSMYISVFVHEFACVHVCETNIWKITKLLVIYMEAPSIKMEWSLPLFHRGDPNHLQPLQ